MDATVHTPRNANRSYPSIRTYLNSNSSFYRYCATGGPWGPVKTYYPLGVCCKKDYPVKFQIGRGMAQASEPIFIWDNKYAGSGAPVNISYGYSNGAAGDNNKKLCNDPALWFDSCIAPRLFACIHVSLLGSL